MKLKFIDKFLRNRQPKYRPLAYTAFVSVYLIAIIFLFAPVMLLLKGAGLPSWPGIYVSLVVFFSPLALSACVLAGLFGQLAYSRMAFPICMVLFGLAVPLVLLGFIDLFLSNQRESVWDNLSTPKGMEDAAFLFLLFGTLGAVLYWSGIRGINKHEMNDA